MNMASIPASQLVTVNPGVVGTGGSPLSLNSVFLTTSTLVPTNTVMPFYDSASVASFFGQAQLKRNWPLNTFWVLITQISNLQLYSFISTTRQRYRRICVAVVSKQ